MKHIKPYISTITESEESWLDFEENDLLPSSEKILRKKARFIEALQKRFESLGLEWPNVAREYVKRRGGAKLEIPLADAYRLITEAEDIIALLPKNRATRFSNLVKGAVEFKEGLSSDSKLTYFFQPAGIKGAYISRYNREEIAKPESSYRLRYDDAIESKGLSEDQMIARFIVTVASDVVPKLRLGIVNNGWNKLNTRAQLTPLEFKVLSEYPSPSVRQEIASKKDCPIEILKVLATDRNEYVAKQAKNNLEDNRHRVDNLFSDF